MARNFFHKNIYDDAERLYSHFVQISLQFFPTFYVNSIHQHETVSGQGELNAHKFGLPHSAAKYMSTFSDMVAICLSC